MNAPVSPPPAPVAAAVPLRVAPNAARAFGGIWRLTVRRYATPGHWLVVAGMLGLLVLFSLPGAGTPEAATRNFLPWACRFYVCFLVPILAFISAAGAMRDDLKLETVDYIFTRPLRRPVFVVFRYVAHVACTQFDFLLALGVVAALGVHRGVPDLGSAVASLFFAQVLAIVAFSALGFLCGMATSRYVILGLVYGGIVEVGIGNVPTQISRFSMLRHVLALLQPFVGEDTGTLGAPTTAVSMPLAVTTLLGFAVVMLAATMAIFSCRELAGAGRDV